MQSVMGKDLTSESAKLALKQAVGWVNLMSKMYADDDNEPRRIIGFAPPYESVKTKKRRKVDNIS